MAVKKSDLIKCQGEGAPSLNCTGGKTADDFYDTFNMWSNGKSCYCKKCLDKIYDSYYKRSGNSDKLALYYALMQINTPLIADIYAKLKSKSDKVTLYKYITEMNKNVTKKNSWADFSSTDIKLVNEENQDFNKNEELTKLEKVWGAQEDIKDYEFLEDTFKRYTEQLEEFTNPQQEDLYRDLCKDRLLARKIRERRYDGDETLDKVQTRINKTMSVLKVDQYEQSKPKTLAEQTMFNKCTVLEMVKPEEVYANPMQYKDYNGRERYYKDMVLRPILNTLCDRKDFDLDITDIERYNIDE